MVDIDNPEVTARGFKNCFGQDVTVSLRADYWTYFDWVQAKGWPMEQWVMEVDAERASTEELSDLIEYDLWCLICTRYKYGLECPEPIPPENYGVFEAGVEAGEIIEARIDRAHMGTHEDLVSKPVFLPNGAVEFVELPRKYWLHVDVFRSLNIDFRAWIAERYDQWCVALPHGSLRDFLIEELSKSEESLCTQNATVPAYINPAGYEKPKFKVWSMAGLVNQNHIERTVTNALGEEETVSLPENHWKHFDWIRSKGKDMDAWVKKLDVERHTHEGFEITLAGYMEMALTKDEDRRQRAGQIVPLFIDPYRSV